MARSSRFRIATLSQRLFLLNTVWAVLSVALIAFVLTAAYRQNAERRFAELVTANLYNLLGSVTADVDGNLRGTPDLRDPRYLRFGSGWYWSVESVSDPTNRLTSVSLADNRIPLPDDLPFDVNFQRLYGYVDSSGQELSAVEARAFLGSGDQVYSFRVTGNKDALSDEIGAFRRTSVFLLTLFGLGFIAASYGIVRLGLRPITGATRRLADIREGRAERLEGDFPREIRPLIDETNALIESNRSVVERARTQVGNLAHSLKTPLAVLMNEAPNAPPALRRILQEQTSLMRDQVQNYLDRARIAARHATVTSRTETDPVLERLVRVVSRLNPQVAIEVTPAESPVVFAGESQDFEEIAGNLLENAARFARLSIRVGVERMPGTDEMVLRIDDDGPGMTDEECALALKRGTRLDESSPGSGLGLAIAKDITGEYGGSLELGRSALGGLAARVRLPAR